jgi:hypothetical protein
VIKPLFSDLNRRLGPLVRSTALDITRDEPVAFGGLFRVVSLRKAAKREPAAHDDANATRSTSYAGHRRD